MEITADHFSAPIPLTNAHDVGDFFCGVSSLDDWLGKRALKNQQSGASRTFVTYIDQKVIGYYCLAAGSVAQAEAPKSLQRNMPDPIPVALLGRLAVDQRYQGKGLGDALLQDAIIRVLYAAETLGIKALLVHAISEQAKRFYLAWDFMPAPVSDMTLCLPLATAKQVISK